MEIINCNTTSIESILFLTNYIVCVVSLISFMILNIVSIIYNYHDMHDNDD